MNKAELYNALYRVNHSREERIEMARRILRSENLVAPLLDLAFISKDPVSIKACLVLEFTVREPPCIRIWTNSRGKSDMYTMNLPSDPSQRSVDTF